MGLTLTEVVLGRNEKKKSVDTRVISVRLIIWILYMNQRVISSVADQEDRSAMCYLLRWERTRVPPCSVEKQGFMCTCN